MKSAGGERAERGMVPAQQRLGAHDPARLEGDLRLVLQPQLAPFEGPAQCLLDHEALHRCRPQPLVGHRHAPAALGLGLGGGHVGVAQEIGSPHEGRPRDGHAQAGVEHDLAAVHRQRHPDCVEHAAGHHHHVGFVPCAHAQHDERIVAGAGHAVAVAHGLLDAGAHHGQHLVAGGGTERGVHQPEPVEVEVDDGHEVAARPAQGLVEAVEQKHPIGEPGDGVVGGLVLQRPLGQDELGDVGDAEHGAAAIEGGHADPIPALALATERQFQLPVGHVAPQHRVHGVGHGEGQSPRRRRQAHGGAHDRGEVIAHHHHDGGVLGSQHHVAPLPVGRRDPAAPVEHHDPHGHGIEDRLDDQRLRAILVNQRVRARSRRSRDRPASTDRSPRAWAAGTVPR